MTHLLQQRDTKNYKPTLVTNTRQNRILAVCGCRREVANLPTRHLPAWPNLQLVSVLPRHSDTKAVPEESLVFDVDEPAEAPEPVWAAAFLV